MGSGAVRESVRYDLQRSRMLDGCRGNFFGESWRLFRGIEVLLRFAVFLAWLVWRWVDSGFGRTFFAAFLDSVLNSVE